MQVSFWDKKMGLFGLLKREGIEMEGVDTLDNQQQSMSISDESAGTHSYDSDSFIKHQECWDIGGSYTQSLAYPYLPWDHEWMNDSASSA